ncbi:MAG: peptidase M28 family protein, partial [Dyadobacter sp.]
MKHKLISAALLALCSTTATFAQSDYQADSIFIRKIFNTALSEGHSYEYLRDLTHKVGARLSGSAGAAKAVEYTRDVMVTEKFDNVFLQNVMVPHWVRGAKEKAYILSGKQKIVVPIAALGGSVATPKGGTKAKVIEVQNFQELRALGADKVKGKIVFFNRPMDPTK